MICNFVLDGRDQYRINICRDGNRYTLHAIAYPPNTRGGTVHEHHLYSNQQICVAVGHEPRTIERAKAVAMSWCDGWSKYVRGAAFPNGRKRIPVNS